MNSKLKEVLAARMMTLNTSGYYANNAMPGAASKFGQKNANATQVLPEQGATVTAKVPTGTPLVPTSLPNGMSIEESVTVSIDFSGATADLTRNRIVLFDEAGFFQAQAGIATPYPAGSVYIGSAANNFYLPWISGLCSQSYHMLFVKIDVTAASGAVATPEMQFSERVIRHEINTRTSSSTQLEVANYKDPQAYAQDSRIIPFTDQKGRIDRAVAWEYYVYNALKVNMTFFVGAYARN